MTGRPSSNCEVELCGTHPHCLAAPCLNICVRVACIIRAAVGVTILTTGMARHPSCAQIVVAIAKSGETCTGGRCRLHVERRGSELELKNAKPAGFPIGSFPRCT